MKFASSLWTYRLILTIGCLCMFCLSPAGNAATRPSSVEDLQYGEALFAYYQQDWFDSIVRLQIAKSQHALPHHADEAELLLGGLNLSYGLRSEATRIFQELLASHSDETTRNRAWYYLAKISWQRGDTDTALQALSRMDGNMSKGTESESALLGSLVLLQLGRNQDAVSLLDSARKKGPWTPYLAYNLGVAQLRLGQLEEGARTLAAIGSMDAASEELRTLRDRANLSLGYSYLQHSKPEQARAQLEKVRLEGPLSNKALLGAGWASADANDFNRSMIPWTELGTRDATDPAVQEALLAMPYSMTRMSLHGRAANEYNAAIETLMAERFALDESIKSIRSGELLAILQQNPGTGSGWLQHLTLDNRSPALRYQVTLMAAHEFQEAVKNYRDLLDLQHNLQHWADSISAFDAMLSAREQRFTSGQPAAQHALQGNMLNALQNRREQLAYRLRTAEQNADFESLANAREMEQLHTLQSIAARLEIMPSTSKTQALQERMSRLHGILIWRLSSEYKTRLWQLKRELAEVSALLDKSVQSLASLGNANRDTPEGFTRFANRIATGQAEIRNLQQRTAATQLAQGKLLEQLAVRELEGQQKRIDTYLVQARFALAQTYDKALHSKTGSAQ